MRIQLINPKRIEELLSRIFYLAYVACRTTCSAGVMEAKTNASEQDIWREACSYPRYLGQIKTDTIFGRKIGIRTNYSVDDGIIILPDEAPKIPHQAWQPRYASYEALLTQASMELAIDWKIK